RDHRQPRACRKMSEQADTAGDPSDRDGDEQPIIRVLEICNKKGLHARASAKFVHTVDQFDALVKVTRGTETVGGNSIMGLMMLAAGPGTKITVEATGKEAAEVIEALTALVTGKFTEGEQLTPHR